MKSLSSLDMKLNRLILLRDQIHVIREEREDLISEMFQVAEREGPTNPKLAKYFQMVSFSMWVKGIHLWRRYLNCLMSCIHDGCFLKRKKGILYWSVRNLWSLWIGYIRRNLYGSERVDCSVRSSKS